MNKGREELRAVDQTIASNRAPTAKPIVIAKPIETQLPLNVTVQQDQSKVAKENDGVVATAEKYPESSQPPHERDGRKVEEGSKYW